MFLESTVHLKQLHICIIELTGSCILHRAWYTRNKEQRTKASNFWSVAEAGRGERASSFDVKWSDVKG